MQGCFTTQQISKAKKNLQKNRTWPEIQPHSLGTAKLNLQYLHCHSGM